jgi:hypothetical protein
MASLIWGLNGSIKLPDGAFFTFSAGGNISIPLSLMISNLPSLPYRVKKAFSSITLDRSPDEILSSISRGKVTIIPIGYDGHAMALVLYKDLLFICDRGTDGETESLRSFRINQKNITIFTLEMLQNIKEAPEAEALKYYYERLPTSLSYGDKLEEITPVFLRLDSKMQKTSNCSAASLKLAIRASLAALAYYENGNTLPDPISAEIYKQSKAATRELRKISYNELKEATEKLTHLQRKEILDLFSEKREKLGIKA